MALVSYNSLCIDVSDESRMARFWSAAAGLDVATHTDGDSILTGPTPQHTISLNDVPEPKTVKHRVHLDVNGGSVAEYEALGAHVLADWVPFAWIVMADPEGGEFCLFERDKSAPRGQEVPPRWDDTYRLYEVCVDAADSRAIASWWADVFGATLRDSDREFFWIEDLEGCPFGSFVFADVPEPKTVKNRIHWDVTLVGDATVDDLATKGAVLLRAPDDEIDWTVMADPEGNEFCVFAADE